MAAPVIQPEQSAPYGLTNHRYGFQAAATNSPTAWTTAGTTLPPGLTLDTATGLVSGTPTLRGDFSFGLQASNSDGDSSVVIFTLRVDGSPPLPPPGYTGVTLNFKDRSVVFDAGTLPMLKSGDDWLQQITLKYGDAVSDAPVTAFKCRLKLGEDDAALTTGESFVKVGDGEDTVYRHATELRGSEIDDALERGIQKVKPKELPTADVAKRIVRIVCLVEYELHLTNSGEDTVGASPAVWTSQTVAVELVRELIPNA